MIKLKGYYVVKHTKDKDELLTTILAASLDEAYAIFQVRYEAEQEQMEDGDAYYLFSEKEKLEFDDNNRLIFPSGRVVSTTKMVF